ncbi:Cobalt-zinc-cadmium resistance protein CzcD [hydrothermal vent metagenome]|uniref:Cobalt-zinc-cadmium resistance protein CzcD n=1 Tax=hydrothermal vent metagenome TaxID=652676 RepID=A0A3B0US19_9ZZZZ
MSNKHIPKNLSNLIIAIIINIGITIFEFTLGILSNSLALISDAFHNATDISSIILGYISERVSTFPTNSEKTYGYKKIEFVTAFVNSLILLIATIYIFYEGISRLFTPTAVSSIQMFYVGIFAVIGNGFATWILSKNSDRNINIKAVWLHSLQDTLVSFGVVIGAAIIYFTGWNIVDPVISILIALFLTKSIFYLLKETLNALLDSVPSNIKYEEVRASLNAINGVVNINDLHIWSASSNTPILSAHIKIEDITKLNDVFIKSRNVLLNKYGIVHTTLQIIPTGTEDNKDPNFKYCN